MLNSHTHTTENRKITTIFGIPITICTFNEAIKLIEEMIHNKKPRLIVLANSHTLNLAYERHDYRQVLKEDCLVLRDGTGTSWAIKKKGIHPLHNFVGTDFIPDFCKYTARKGYRIYLLGSRPDVCETAARRLRALAPGTVVAGHHHGYFRDEQTAEIINKINKARADILLVAMGNPKQEIWITRNLDRLNVPVCIGVGALFNYLSGRQARAPQWMLSAGMEWVFRLLAEPKRLWKRYLIGNPKFVMRIYREHVNSCRNDKETGK